MSPWPSLVEAGNTIGREESSGIGRVYRRALQLHPPWSVNGVSGREDMLEW